MGTNKHKILGGVESPSNWLTKPRPRVRIIHTQDIPCVKMETGQTLKL